MTTLQINRTLTIKTTACCRCGVIVALTAELFNQRINDHESFWCPNGHRQHFTGKSEAEKLAEQLERKQRRLIWKQNELEARKLDDTRQRKGQLTKAKKRAAAALCPADGCGRSFVQLQRHISSKHPELVEVPAQ